LASLGFTAEKILLHKNAPKEQILETIHNMNIDSNIHGILLYLPLPDALRLDQQLILSEIDPEKDVDNLNVVNYFKMMVCLLP